MSGGRGEGGNREVSPLLFLGARGEERGARAEGCPKEGGSRGKHGSPRGSEPQASDAHVYVLPAELDVARLIRRGLDVAEPLHRQLLDARGRGCARELGEERGVVGAQACTLTV